jgi:hypothetical protein
MRYGNIIKSYEIPFKQWSPARQAQWKNGMLKNLLEINRGIVAVSYGVEYDQVTPIIFGALGKSDKEFPIPLDGTLSPTDSQGLQQGKEYACLLWEYFVGVNLLETPKVLEPPANALNNNNTEPVVKEPEKEVLPEPVKQDASQEDDGEQEEKETIKEVTKLTDEIDKEDDKKSSPKEEDNDKDFDKISDALKNIKGSISSQASIVTAISNTNSGSIQTLGLIKDIFTTQNELIKKQFEDEESRQNEAAVEQSTKNSGSVKSTSTMDTGNASGEIIKIDGDVLTVKPTEGSFQEGQQISSGGGGFDLFGMLKGIAGKFGKGKGGGGGGGSPIKMSMGGFLNTAYPAMAKGGISPGIYDKPTRGNLMPGQAVIPLNRNIGKNLDPRKKVLNKSQPFADVMQTPVKAIGAAIIATAGNFIRALGPLGGFFAPYITSLINPMGLVLGLSTSVIESILGGPAYAAALDQDKQQNVFAKLWSDLMKVFGFNFDADKEDKKDKKNNTNNNITADNIDGTTAERAAKVATQLMSSLGLKDFQAAGIVGNLLAESGLEAARVQNTPAGQKGLLKVDGYTGYGYAQWTTAGRQKGLWDFAKSKGVDPATQPLTDGVNLGYLVKEFKESYGGVLSSLKSSSSLSEASNIVLKDFEAPADSGPSVQTVRASKGKAVLDKMSAESGGMFNSPYSGDAFTLSGPNSGYDVPALGIQMHGKEIVVPNEYENGFTVLPVENNRFSLKNDPLRTLMQWKNIFSSKSKPVDPGIGSRPKFAAGGKVTLYAGHADMTSDSPGGKGTNGGADGGAPKIADASGYFTTEAYLNDKIAAAAAAKSGGMAEYRAPIKTRNGSDSKSNWERARKDAAGGNSPIEIHHDAESGHGGMIATDQQSINKNKFFKGVNDSFGFYRTGNEGFVSRGGTILEMAALSKSIRQNPSSWISSASTQLADAIKKGAGMKVDDTNSNDTTNQTSPSESTQSEDPFVNMENAIKSMSVGFGLSAAVRDGSVTDEASFKAMQTRLTAAAGAEVTTPKTPTITPSKQAAPSNVHVVSKGSEKVIMVGSGSNAKQVGTMLNNLCVPNYG